MMIKNNVPRPSYWSGWNLSPVEVLNFGWMVDNRIHERLKYIHRQTTVKIGIKFFY